MSKCVHCGCPELDHSEDDKGQCNNCYEGMCEKHEQYNSNCEICDTTCIGYTS